MGQTNAVDYEIFIAFSIEVQWDSKESRDHLYHECAFLKRI